MYKDTFETDQTYSVNYDPTLGMKFHTFLLIMSGIGLAFLIIGTLSSVITYGPSTLMGNLISLGLQGLLFYLLKTKSRHIITYYKIYFWFVLVFGTLGTLGLTFVFSALFGLMGIDVSFAAGIIIFTTLISVVITSCIVARLIIRYYKKRLHLLN